MSHAWHEHPTPTAANAPAIADANDAGDAQGLEDASVEDDVAEDEGVEDEGVEQEVVETDGKGAVLLRGRGLRFVLVAELRDREAPMTVAEMVTVLAEYGFDVGGRASKVISDALRWELARGRVQRLGRGVYCYRRAPVSTARRIRIFAEACRAWLVAPTRTGHPKQTPGDHDNPAQAHTGDHHPAHNRAWAQTSVPDPTRPQTDHQTEPQTRQTQPSPGDGSGRPPWEHLGWLWAA